jgi:hypothetical protein
MVIRNNQIRLFEKHLAALPEIDELPPRKIALWAKKTVIIPPHAIGFIVVSGPQDYTGDVYVEGVAGQEPNHEYTIPRCITTTGRMLSVRSLADTHKEVKTASLLVRGFPCLKVVEPTQWG